MTIGTAASAADLALYTTVDVTLSGYLMESPGKAWLYDGYGGPTVVYHLSGQHMIVSSSYQIVANYSVKTDNTYENTINASGTAGACYEGKIDITADSGNVTVQLG